MQPGGSPWISAVAQILVVGDLPRRDCVSDLAIWPTVHAGPAQEKEETWKRASSWENGLSLIRLRQIFWPRPTRWRATAICVAAIRKAYIALLCELGDRKLISHRSIQNQSRLSLFSPRQGFSVQFDAKADGEFRASLVRAGARRRERLERFSKRLSEDIENGIRMST